MPFQTRHKQDRGPLSLHFFSSVSGLYHVLISLKSQLQKKRVLSEAKRLASCLCFLSVLNALTQTQQLKTTDSFCGSAIQAQARQLLLAQDPSQGCRASFIRGLCGGGSASELTHVAAGSLRSFLAVSQGLSTEQLTTQHLSSLRAEEGESRPKLETRLS